MHIINLLVDLALILLLLIPLYFKFSLLFNEYLESKGSFKKYLSKTLNHFVLIDDLIGMGIITCYYFLRILHFDGRYNFIWFILIFLIIIYAILSFRGIKDKVWRKHLKLTSTQIIIISNILSCLLISSIILYISNFYTLILCYLSLLIFGKYFLSIKFYTIDKLIYLICEKALMKKFSKRIFKILFIKNETHKDIIDLISHITPKQNIFKTSEINHYHLCDYLSEVISNSYHSYCLTYLPDKLNNIKMSNYLQISNDEAQIVFQNNKLVSKVDFEYQVSFTDKNHINLDVFLKSEKIFQTTMKKTLQHNYQVYALTILILNLLKVKVRKENINRLFISGGMHQEDEIIFYNVKDTRDLNELLSLFSTQRDIILTIKDEGSNVALTQKLLLNSLKFGNKHLTGIIYVGPYQKLVKKICQHKSRVKYLYLYQNESLANTLITQLPFKKPYNIITILCKE